MEAASGFEPLNRGFADPRLNHLATPPWCRGRDLNSHGLAPTTPSRWRVYRFHHPGFHLGANILQVPWAITSWPKHLPLEASSLEGSKNLQSRHCCPAGPWGSYFTSISLAPSTLLLWQGWQDSNPRPAVLETAALSSELQGHVEIGGFEPPTSAMRTQRSPY